MTKPATRTLRRALRRARTRIANANDTVNDIEHSLAHDGAAATGQVRQLSIALANDVGRAALALAEAQAAIAALAVGPAQPDTGGNEE